MKSDIEEKMSIEPKMATEMTSKMTPETEEKISYMKKEIHSRPRLESVLQKKENNGVMILNP